MTTISPALKVPMSSPDLTDAERQAVAAVLRTPSLSMGEQIVRFETAFQAYTGASQAVAVSSGTAGLHLCVRAAGLSEADLAITTAFSFVASANVLLFERAIPVFVDVDPETGNIDPKLAAEAADDLRRGGRAARAWLPRQGVPSPGPLKALLPVDVFGQPADMDQIGEIAALHDLKVIEDSCEALGAAYKGRKAGMLGDYGVFAFYPNKQITTGEGAVILTDDRQSAQTFRALRNQGRAPGDTWLQHSLLGYNYRLDELSAALGCVQLSRIETLLDKRARVAGWYEERLLDIPGIETLTISPHTTRMSWFVYVVRFSTSNDRNRVASQLQARGIPNRPYFVPIHLQPYMVARFGYRLGDLPVTEDLGARSLALPFSGVMTEEQVEIVCDTLGSLM